MFKQLLAIAVYTSVIANSLLNATSAQEGDAKSYPVLSGVGLALSSKEGHIVVFKILPNSSADESGLIKAGSRLLSVEVNGVTVKLDGKSTSDAASLIRGPVGTEIVLTLVPPNDEMSIDVTLLRKPLELAGVPDSTYDAFIGKPIADFHLSSLDGATRKVLSDYRGKIVVLDFWASWCPTCYAPVTKMQKISKDNPQWADKVELVTVTVDSDLTKAIDVVKQQNWNRTRNFAIDFEELKTTGVSVVPVIIVVAPNGTIATMGGAHALDIEKEVTAFLDK